MENLNSKIEAIKRKRRLSLPLPLIEAPFTCSDEFKFGDHTNKPDSKTWDHRFSIATRTLRPCPLRESSRNERDPSNTGMLSLGSARQASEYFPWRSMSMEVLPSEYFPGQAMPTLTLTSNTSGPSENSFDLSLAMNYGFSAGSPQVLRFITEHVEIIHDPPYKDWGCCVTCGSTSAIEVAFRIFCNREDWILCEKLTHTRTIKAARAHGLNMMGVKLDDEGLSPSHLDSILSNWDDQMGRKPFLLHMTPTGHNPTGATQSEERRRAIYQVAERHDLYILEDDPYYFIDLADGLGSDHPDAYIRQLPRSYLSLDTSGRVLRMDSISKFLAPGLRCGWVTASAEVIAKFTLQSEASVLCPSGPSQALLYMLLDRAWGHNGLIQWLINLSGQYIRRCNVIRRALEGSLPEYCSWMVPEMGMFFWIKVDTSDYPLRGLVTDVDIEDSIFQEAILNGVLVSRGSWFSVDGEQAEGSVYFRLSFAGASTNRLALAVSRFAAAVRREFEMTLDEVRGH